MKPLFLLLLATVAIISCNNSIERSPEQKLKDSLAYLQASYNFKVDSTKMIIFLCIQKANDDTLSSAEEKRLQQADSSDVNWLIKHRLLVKQKKKLQSELDSKIAGGTNRETILRYKVWLGETDKEISQGIADHYWLYKSDYWDDLHNRFMEE